MRTLALLALLAVPSAAQVLTSVSPDIADPGDIVILRGAGLGSVTAVNFTAKVGGLLGFDSRDVVPLTVTATEVRVVVPQMAGFAPPSAVPESSSPLGTISAKGPGESGKHSFLFLQGVFPFGSMTTLEVAGTQSSGVGSPVISLDLDDDLPVAGAASVAFRLENAVPGTVSIFLGGLEAQQPYLPVGGGSLAVDLLSFVQLASPFTDSSGEASLALPVSPNLAGKTAVLQWGVVDFGVAGAVVPATAMRVTF